MVKKTFIKTGLTYIDLGPLCSFRFTSDPEGYVNCHFYFLSRENPVIVKIPNRNELAELFVALDQYFDGTLQESLNTLIDQIILKMIIYKNPQNLLRKNEIEKMEIKIKRNNYYSFLF